MVDISGNTRVLAAVHRDSTPRSTTTAASVPRTGRRGKRPRCWPGPPNALFFAPDQAKKRREEWGAQGFAQRTGAQMLEFFHASSKWLRVVEGRGEAAVEHAYRVYVEGKADPAEGHVAGL